MRINRKYQIAVGTAIVSLVAVAAAATDRDPEGASPPFAKAKLRDASGQVVGDVRFQHEHHAVTARVQSHIADRLRRVPRLPHPRQQPRPDQRDPPGLRPRNGVHIGRRPLGRRRSHARQSHW